VKGTEVFIEFDLNEDAVLAALLIDSKDFSGDRGHMCHFLRQTSAEVGPVFKASGTKSHQRRRENAEDTRACRPLSRGYSQNRESLFVKLRD
jgi:hypothetical protein